ncbi:MAG TPA: A/G-specific adenine glycosylase [Candidatus Nanoarchaeia archaeon]|nr:A/G-specific adenine glycosylase [Candidatus Nanoarchaeia archaeon]
MQDSFRSTIYHHYYEKGRKLAWRHVKYSYKVLVSEFMLQQTQVKRVKDYFPAFIKKFPTFKALAHSKSSEVIKAWSGLGYNRRALFLKKTAEIVSEKFKGKLPDDIDTLQSLPGIGHATACEIAAFAFNKPVIFIETNIRTVFIHFFFKNKSKVDDKEVIKLVEKTLDKKNPRDWYYALMDYGVMLKQKYPNPNRKSKQYYKQPKFEGSNRQVRGQILKLLGKKNVSKEELIRKIDRDSILTIKILEGLEREGFVEKKKKRYRIK